MDSLIIVGAGGHGRSIAEAVLGSGQYELVGFVDDSQTSGDQVFGLPVIGTVASLAHSAPLASHVIVAIGANRVRQKIHQIIHGLRLTLAVVVHARAVVSPSAIIGPGAAVMSGAVVGTEARLGEGAIINCGAVVDHHCVVEDFGHVGTGASMAGGSRIQRCAWLQAGSALGYGVSVPAEDVLRPAEGRSLL